ncbi:MAG: DUF5317 family protein [Chloroflexota bacterium]
MFILYAVLAGLVVGLLLGGRVGGLSRLDLRWTWLAIGGFLVQVVLFSTPVTDRVGALGPIVYVLSTAAVLLAVLRNLAIPAMWVVALGAGLNLVAIVTNGGYMPADPAALAALGHGLPDSYTNSAVVAAPALQPLTDVFVLPAGIPFRNVFSIGDALIGLGIAGVIVVAMRRDPRGAPRQLPQLSGDAGTPVP